MGVINSQFEAEFIDARVVLSNVDCLTSVYIGAAVIISGGVASNALADSMANSNVIGVVESKPSATKCNIRVLGVTEGDIFTSLDETKEYYLSDSVAGSIVDAPPSSSGSILLRIGQPFDTKNMLVVKGIRTVRL
jgi:hypothetical protein